jgi:hypothetical protein
MCGNRTQQRTVFTVIFKAPEAVMHFKSFKMYDGKLFISLRHKPRELRVKSERPAETVAQVEAATPAEPVAAPEFAAAAKVAEVVEQAGLPVDVETAVEVEAVPAAPASSEADGEALVVSLCEAAHAKAILPNAKPTKAALTALMTLVGEKGLSKVKVEVLKSKLVGLEGRVREAIQGHSGA